MTQPATDAAGPQDVEAITALEVAALGPDAWSRTLVAQGVEGDLPTVHYRVVREAGRVVAYAVVSVVGEVAELQRIAVEAGHRRSGLATLLLADVVRRAAADGAGRLLLEVREDNAGAVAFYAASGFVALARRPRYYRDGTTAVVMQLPLAGEPETGVLQ
ncbi:GNAT family N-acetyltransferase [Nocardioides sp. GXQ0305]|uniref:GNAT family N-acetyltransferase n=1 Tax=Nocardioides sp. GXQ0305 TaxID=3423912 RepID=UPI003D7D8DE0